MLFALCCLSALLVQWLCFVPAYICQTEKYYDLVGSLTYITIAISALFLSDSADARSLLIAALVVVWAMRLGSFLFLRILADGHDGRFDRIKPNPVRFFTTWTMQGVWVAVTLSAGLAAITGQRSVEPDGWMMVGALVWLSGMTIEVVADRQKRQFRRAPQNQGRFIDTGLWSRSQHPNYFGEIMLWVGIALIAVPVLQGWQWLTLASPLFVYLLLTRVSGIPLLKARARRRWGDDEDYQAYRRRTPLLVPSLRVRRDQY